MQDIRNKKYRLLYLVLSTFILISFVVPAHAQSGHIFTKQWGEYGDGPGQFKYPTMIAVDASGDVYVVDQHNQRIQKFSSDGKFILMWGSQGSGNGEFRYPYGVAVDSKGDVYVSDMNNHRIQKFTSSGEFIKSAGSYGDKDGMLKYPYGIAIDKKDVIYVIDAFNYRVQLFDRDLHFISKWGSEKEIGFRLYMPHEIAIAAGGNVILSDRQNHRISVFTTEGTPVKRFGEFGEGRDTGDGHFSEPHGVAVNRKGEIFVCDRYNFRIQQFSAKNELISAWITPGDLDDSSHFPMGIVAGNGGMVYVTDHYAHCVQVFRP